MIVTVTPNPSVDRTLELDDLQRGEVLRARDSRIDPGGKGVNVARALVSNDCATEVIVPIGGSDGRQLEDLIREANIPYHPVRIRGNVRANISLVEPDGTVTKVNARGPVLSPEEGDALRRAVVESGRGATWVAACGSLPRGLDDSFYADVVRDVKQMGAAVAVDTSGAALASTIDAGPDLIKPNAEELAELVGRRLDTFGDVVEAAGELLARGVGALVISLGSDGAVLVDGQGATHAWSDPVVPVSNVGAGDATLAGYLAGGGAGVEALRLAVAFGTAAVQLPGTAMPEPHHIDAVSIYSDDVDTAKFLEERQKGNT